MHVVHVDSAQQCEVSFLALEELGFKSLFLTPNSMFFLPLYSAFYMVLISNNNSLYASPPLASYHYFSLLTHVTSLSLRANSSPVTDGVKPQGVLWGLGEEGLRAASVRLTQSQR